MLDGSIYDLIFRRPETKQIYLSINFNGSFSLNKCLACFRFIKSHSVYSFNFDAKADFLYEFLMEALDYFFLQEVVHVAELVWLEDELVLDGEEFEHL